MSRPRSASTCGQEARVTIGGQVQVVACARGEAHPHDHQGKVRWSPRLAPTGRPTARERKED